MTKPNLFCYSTVREFGGYSLPVPIQNQLLKTYCEKNNFIYKLSIVESYIKDNYMYLNNLIDSVSEQANIGMCSIYMFPKEIEKFKALEASICKKELVLHFLFENCKISFNDLNSFYLNSRLRFLHNEEESIEEIIRIME
jgi:sporadic carbohydrate cluster protein (TIGR04323 family)